MLINDIVKNFISEQIRFDNYKNIQLLLNAQMK